MKKRKLTLALILLLLAVFAATVIVALPKRFEHEGLIVIAHAGGDIDGMIYTNSREALEESIAEGYRFIELDLMKSSDGFLFAAHDWKHFQNYTGGRAEEIPTLAEVRARKIYGKYTVLDYEEIAEIFSANPDLYLVTDKADDFLAIREQLGIPPERLLVEVFTRKDYFRALVSGIKHPMLAMRSEKTFKRRKFLAELGLVKIITIHKDVAEKVLDELERLVGKGVHVFVYTVNDEDFARKYSGKSFTGIYTDRIRP